MKKPITREKLLKDITDFCNKWQISWTNFGVLAVNDSALVCRMQQGRSPTLERIELIYDFMEMFEAVKAKELAEDLYA